jgi:hypothetical protein
MLLSPDFRDFIASLNANGVRYLVVGGYAVALHGHPRYTKDVEAVVCRHHSLAWRGVRGAAARRTLQTLPGYLDHPPAQVLLKVADPDPVRVRQRQGGLMPRGEGGAGMRASLPDDQRGMAGDAASQIAVPYLRLAR